METVLFSTESGTLHRRNPVASRPTTVMLLHEAGTIIELDAGLPGILYGKLTALPINLPDILRKPGINVVFSGEIKQIKNLEFWAAMPLLLTHIKLI
ncbi:MAG: hypothetical protein QM731_06245 [Chitinophagaceae bacterium]